MSAAGKPDVARRLSERINHKAEAERLIAQYRESEAAVRTTTTLIMEAGGDEAGANFARDMLPGLALILQEAQVHATLATVRP